MLNSSVKKFFVVIFGCSFFTCFAEPHVDWPKSKEWPDYFVIRKLSGTGKNDEILAEFITTEFYLRPNKKLEDSYIPQKGYHVLWMYADGSRMARVVHSLDRKVEVKVPGGEITKISFADLIEIVNKRRKEAINKGKALKNMNAVPREPEEKPNKGEGKAEASKATGSVREK